MIHNFKNIESWEDKARNIQKLGNSKLVGFDPTPSMNYNVYPFESFTLPSLRKCLVVGILNLVTILSLWEFMEI